MSLSRLLCVSKRIVPFKSLQYSCQSRPSLTWRLLCTDTPKDRLSLPSGSLPRSRRPLKTYQLGSARNKAILLRSFEDLCREKEISPVSAYNALKNCGRQLADATPETRVSLAKDFMETFESKGVQLDVTHYNALLSVFIENSHEFSPLDFLVKLQGSNIQPSQATYQLVLKGFCQQGNLQGAMEVLEHIKGLNISFSEPLLAPLVTCNARNGDMDKARAVFQLIKENGLEPGLESYTALLCAYAEHGDLEAIHQVLGEMQENRVFPSHGVYIQVLESLSRSKHSHLIPDLLAKIRNKQWMAMDLQGLLNSFAACGDFEGALHMLRCIGHASPSSPLRFNNAGRDFFLKLIRAEPSLPLDYLLEKAQQLNVENLHRHTYEDLLYSRFLTQDKDGALTIIREMLAANIEVRQHYFYPVLASQEKEENLDGACQTLKLMLDHGVALEIPHFQYLIKTCVDHDMNKPGLAATLLSAFDKSGISFGREVNSLVQVCCDFNQLDAALKILESVDESVVLPQRFLRSVAKQGEIREGIPVKDSSSMKIFKLVAEITKTFKILPHYAGQFLLKNVERMPIGSGLSPLLTSLKEFFEMGIKVDDPKVYSALLRLCVDKKDSETFLVILGLMKENDISLYPHHHRLTVSMGALRGHSQMAQQAFSKFAEMQSPDRKIYSDLMVAYGKTKNLSAVNRLYEAMLKEGFRPSPSAFGYAIIAYLSIGDIQSADQLMEDMVKTYRAGYAVYSNYIQAYSRKGDVAGARKKFEEMVAAEHRPSSFAYQKLMAAHAFHGDHETVVLLVEEMKAAGMPIDRRIWSTLIDAYVNGEDVDSAKAIADEAKEKEVKPLLFSYIRLLNLAVLKKKTELVEEVTKDMRTVMGMNNSDLQHALLFAYFKAGDLAEAQKILQDPDFVGNDRSFMMFANSCARRGEVEKIVLAMDLLTKMDMASKYRLFSIPLLIAYEKNSDGVQALALYEKMKDGGIEMSPRFLTLLSSILRSTGHEVPYAVPSAGTTVDEEVQPSSDDVNT